MTISNGRSSTSPTGSSVVNPKGTLVNTSPEKIFRDMRKELSEMYAEDMRSEANTEAERKRLKELFEGEKAITEELRKQAEYRKADLSRKSEILKEEAEQFVVADRMLKTYMQRLKGEKELSELSKADQHRYERAAKYESEIADSLKYRQTLLQNQQKWYDESLKKNSTVLQRTDRLKEKISSARKDFDSLNKAKMDEQVKHDVHLKELALRRDTHQMTEEDYKNAVEDENKGFSEAMGKLNEELKELSRLSLIAKTLDLISKTLSTIGKAVDSGIQQAADDRRNYQGRVDARLQGLEGVNFQHFTETAMQWSSSSLINQSKYIASVAKLSDQGIAYNLENRALIETIGDKLVTTFETTNDTLLRLTRIQQSDLTVSQLGAEARLTQFLNARYQDTSYLNGMYDSIRDTLLDAASLMSVDESTSFMYDVQKWLGSLYSMGVSQQGVQSIAQGIAMLGSGNATSLSSNAPLQTLIVQSLNRAGYNYADILHRGLDAETTNNLLKSMVENLQSIATNTSSNVLKSAWGNIVGIGTTDLRAITHLQDTDLVAISNERMNYASTINEAQTQLSMVNDRTYISEQIDNYLNNMVYGIGSAVAGNRESYLTYRGTNLAKNLVGTLFGDVSNGILGTLLNGISGLVQAGTILNALSSSPYGGPDSSSWGAIGEYFGNVLTGGLNLLSGKQSLSMLNWDQYTSRGDLLSSYMTTETAPGLSYSGTMTQVGNTADMSTFASQESAVSASYETVTDATATVVRDASDIYHELFEAQTTPIKVKLSDIEKDAMDKLMLTGGGNYPVDVIDSDINAVGQVLKSLPLVRTDDW